ncbi:MAG: hypothetical protein GQ565_08085 [Candidatus Aegiribacteria sp.]|nr:hypothetical protein [Candidatus Aegiribacteria sp.]
MSQGIWILHLSDLHLGPSPGDVQGILSRLDEVKPDWERVTSVMQPDLCMITGDLTQSGSVIEYANLTFFVNRLKEWLNVNSNGHVPIFLVPGNHDQVRLSLQASKTDSLRDDFNENYRPLEKVEKNEQNPIYLRRVHPCFSLARENPIAANNIWANKDDAWELGVRPRFENYDMWLKKEFPHLLSIRGLKGGCWRYRAVVRDITFDIIGLNSAVASTGWHEDLDHKYFWLSSEQIKMAMDGYYPLEIPVVALMHHPFSMLAHTDMKADGSVPFLKQQACLVLSGHVHGDSWGDLQVGTYDAPNIYASAFGDPRGGTLHGYSIIHLGSGDTIQYLRIWSVNNSKFVTDTITGPENGIMRYNCGYNCQADGQKVLSRYPTFDRASRASSAVEVEPPSTSISPIALLPQIELYASQPSLPELSTLILMVMRLSAVSTSSAVQQAADELLAVLKKQGHNVSIIVQDKVTDLTSVIVKQYRDESQ